MNQHPLTPEELKRRMLVDAQNEQQPTDPPPPPNFDDLPSQEKNSAPEPNPERTKTGEPVQLDDDYTAGEGIEQLINFIQGEPLPIPPNVQRKKYDEFIQSLPPVLRESLEPKFEQLLLKVFKTDPRAVAELLAGEKFNFQNLEEMAKDLPPLQWYWKNWIATGMLCILAAVPGAGKSMIALYLAWLQIHGKTFPDGSPIPNPGAPVIYVDAENIPQLMNERAQWWNIDRKKLYPVIPDDEEIFDLNIEKYKTKLHQMIATLKPGLVIIDSLSTINSKGENAIEDIRQVLGFLTYLARFYDIPIVLIHHIRKRGNGEKSLFIDLDQDDLRGSSHIVAAGRTIIGLSRVKTNPDNEDGPRKFAMLKTSLGPTPKALGIDFVPMYPAGITLKWNLEPPQPYRQPTQRDECKQWLLTLLEKEPLKPEDVIVYGKEHGFSERTIYRARSELKEEICNTGGFRDPNNLWQLCHSATLT